MKVKAEIEDLKKQVELLFDHIKALHKVLGYETKWKSGFELIEENFPFRLVKKDSIKVDKDIGDPRDKEMRSSFVEPDIKVEGGGSLNLQEQKVKSFVEYLKTALSEKEKKEIESLYERWSYGDK